VSRHLVGVGLAGICLFIEFPFTTEMSDGEHMVCVHIVQGY
jgi:hypothetical protein